MTKKNPEKQLTILTLMRLDSARRFHGRWSTKYTGNVITSHTNAMIRIALMAVWTHTLSILKKNAISSMFFVCLFVLSWVSSRLSTVLRINDWNENLVANCTTKIRSTRTNVKQSNENSDSDTRRCQWELVWYRLKIDSSTDLNCRILIQLCFYFFFFF